MKGELTVEYLISFMIFVGIIGYVYISYSANIPSFVEEVRKEDARSKAFQLSELLVNDPGEPIRWNYLSLCDFNEDGVYNMTDIDILVTCFFNSEDNNNCSYGSTCNDILCVNLPSGPGEPFECDPGVDCGSCPDVCCPQCDITGGNDDPDSGIPDGKIGMKDGSYCAVVFQQNTSRIGFLDHESNKQNLISKDKVLILTMGFDCSTMDGYKNLAKKVGINESFSIIVSEINLTDESRDTIYTCTPPFPVKKTINATIARVVTLNDKGILKPAEVIIQM